MRRIPSGWSCPHAIPKPDITEREVRSDVQGMRSGKAAGPEVKADMLKVLVERGVK